MKKYKKYLKIFIYEGRSSSVTFRFESSICHFIGLSKSSMYYIEFVPIWVISSVTRNGLPIAFSIYYFHVDVRDFYHIYILSRSSISESFSSLTLINDRRHRQHWHTEIFVLDFVIRVRELKLSEMEDLGEIYMW